MAAGRKKTPDTALSQYSPTELMQRNVTAGWFYSNVPGEEVENTHDSGYTCRFLTTQEPVRMTDMYQLELAIRKAAWVFCIACISFPQRV